MKTLIIVCLMMIAGCATLPSNEASTMSVRWVYQDDLALQATCVSLRMRKVGDRVKGCFKMEQGVCVIYTKAPTASNEFDVHETAGHELHHCKEGNFH